MYIVTNKRNKVLYTGVCGDLKKRIYEHKNKLVEGFTKRYNADKLVFYETFGSAVEAISVEKKIKGWLRTKKVALIESVNPEWIELKP